MGFWQSTLQALWATPVLTPFLTVVMVMLLGVGAQVIAYKLKMPGIIFLLLGGMLFGPSGLGLVRPEVFGDGLRSLMALCVAVIVFEGAMLIDLHHLLKASRAVLGLITVGAVVTTLLTAFFSWFFLHLSFPVALLFGAIVCVTGPTVVQPIMGRLSVSQKLKATLEGESVFLDAVGVLMAAAIFSAILYEGTGPVFGLAHVLRNLALGGMIGAGVAIATWLLVNRLAPVPGPLLRLGILSSALLTYGLAEMAADETGIMAVATAGIFFGSLPIPYADTVKRLERDLTVLALSLVFILLAANVRLDAVYGLGWQGLALVLVIMLVVRPVSAFLSTWGADLSRREKVFIALFSPRGIVAASTATFFSIELLANGVAEARVLAELVFLLVLVTVVLEGTSAPVLAQKLGLIPPKVFILGGDKHARRLAENQIEQGESVQLIDENLDNVHTMLDRDLPVAHTRLADYRKLAKLGAHNAKLVVVATDDDTRNVQLARLLRRHFPQVRLFVRLGKEASEDLRQVCRELNVELWPQTEDKPRPLPLSVWNSAIQPDAVRETRVENDAVTGVPLAELSLPAGALVIAIKRDGRMFVPRGHTRLRRGDWATIVGELQAVEEARRMLKRA